MTYRWSQSPVVWCFLLGAAVFLWALRPIWDMDLWWHIALGNWILENGFPTTDPLAIGRSETPWSTFQGGYGVFVAVLERWGGHRAPAHAVAIGIVGGSRGACSDWVKRNATACAMGLCFFCGNRFGCDLMCFTLFLSLFLAAQCHLNRMWHRRDLVWILRSSSPGLRFTAPVPSGDFCQLERRQLPIQNTGQAGKCWRELSWLSW